jgi:hypothetical protein
MAITHCMSVFEYDQTDISPETTGISFVSCQLDQYHEGDHRWQDPTNPALVYTWTDEQASWLVQDLMIDPEFREILTAFLFGAEGAT